MYRLLDGISYALNDKFNMVSEPVNLYLARLKVRSPSSWLVNTSPSAEENCPVRGQLVVPFVLDRRKNTKFVDSYWEWMFSGTWQKILHNNMGLSVENTISH